MTSPDVIEKLEFRKVLSYISKYCLTEKGKDEVLNLLPESDLNHVINEGELVSEAKNILIRIEQPPIEHLSNLDESLSQSRIEGSVLDIKKIWEIYRLAVVSRTLFQFLKNNSELSPKLFTLASTLFVDKVFEHHIRKIIGENGEILENASHKLQEIRKEIREKNHDLIRAVNKIIKSLRESDFVREDYLTLRDGRIVIPVKVEHKRHIRGFIHSESSSGQTVYIEPEETLELNNELVSLSFAERREIERLLKELTKLIGTYAAQLKDSLSVVTKYDSIFARAKHSMEIIGSFPQLNKKEKIILSDARHPILLRKLGRDNTVPLNITIDQDRVIIITGPNAGGKTVVLKTIGLFSLMVQSGIHIPASPDSNLHLFDHIFVDIGDQQSIEDDLSTFSSHLFNIKNILEKAGEQSLVLIDEVGAGTDPAEGSAIAASVLIELYNKGAIVFASTHHGSLKLIANETKGFENAAMEFNHKDLRPTYVFKQGIPGSSYAFEIAGRIGMQEQTLETAKQYLDSDKHKLESFLVEIETKSNMLDEKIKHLDNENRRLKEITKSYEQNLNKLNTEKRDIIKKSKQDAEDLLKGINKKIESVVKELKESNAQKENIKSVKEILKQLKQETSSIEVPEVNDVLEESENISVGDYVRLKNTATEGKVTEIIPGKKKAFILAGKIKMQVPLKELNIVKRDKKAEKAEISGHVIINSPKIRLDIRGERPEEAEFEVIRFVDDAYSSSINRIEILHGKGTGALKKTVKDILQNHDKVKNFYFAPIEFGGDGITIAELK
ncbi:MAG: endonuclease MutS2 [Ignavibacteriales bacterium]|nr:MAG: endonuclease MutS2 [Ignavibacteriales bacterium]